MKPFRAFAAPLIALFVASSTALACGSDASAPSVADTLPNGASPSAPATGDADSAAPKGPEADAGGADTSSAPLAFVAVTFNTGTTDGLDHDAPPADGYTSDHAKRSNDYYGDGLAWNAAIDDAKTFFAGVSPDVVVFQEIFHAADCPSVPQSARAGFLCETWTPGDPLVTQKVLGGAYQIACNLGKPDKCAAVKKTFGTFRGCAGDVCLDGLEGARINDCGGGSRVGRGTIDLAAGGTITLVNVHGSSGFKPADSDCRTKQVEQVFVNLVGGPAANGARNLVMGDFNTDPGRLTILDSSARRWGDFVGKGKPFQFLTDVGSSAAPTYGSSLLGLLGQGFNIDHIVSDVFEGSCWTAGVSAGHAPVSKMTYFDHKPAVCNLTEKKK